ncbi:MAG: hypothetical protein M1831_007336 [Alyxoria varia]|nr:MAG: hypothetical protein M1831_007336 [Alyxoria varia]
MHRIHSFASSHVSDRSARKRSTPSSGLPTSDPNSNAANPASRPATRGSNADHKSGNASNAQDNVPDVTSNALPPPAPPPDTQNEGAHDTAITSTGKPAWSQRAKKGGKRFYKHTKAAITYSWLNVLLVFVPIGIAVNWLPLDEHTRPTLVFAMNAVAIVPLAGLLSHATETIASNMGDTWASLLNVTFGNAVELIIFIIALVKNEIRIVQASIIGSVLANLLLILDNDEADDRTVKISRGTSVVLLLVYILYLVFQLKSHAYMYESTPQQVIDEESHPGVLAEIMNSSSSSDDSDSTSSTSSDSSSGSHNTAKKRIKRAFRRRRKSSGSSTALPSVMSSPFTERASNPGESSTPPEESYFDRARAQREAYAAPTIISGDEGDTDGENDRQEMEPQVRDFETEHGGSNSKSPSNRRERREKKKKKSHRKSKSKASETKSELQNIPQEPTLDEKDELAIPQSAPAHPRHVSIIDSPEIIPEADKSQNGQRTVAGASPRRHFARQLSRPSFKPPPFLSNTVFTTPQPQPLGGLQAAGPSIAHRPGMRRTNSLPDRLNRQSPAGRAQPQAAAANYATEAPHTRSGVLAVNPPDARLKDDEDEKEPHMSRTAGVVLLIATTALVAFCAELLVDAIPEMIEDTPLSQAFIGLIILPIVGNAAEHVTAVVVATKNKMDLAIGVAVGSSIQIALFVTPLIVLLGWILKTEMSLYFNLFETISLFVAAFVVNFLVLDGRSNYLEGALLIAAYVIIALAAFFYPDNDAQSALGGKSGSEAQL